MHNTKNRFKLINIRARNLAPRYGVIRVSTLRTIFRTRKKKKKKKKNAKIFLFARWLALIL